MKRVEQDSREQLEIEQALRNAATPTHESSDRVLQDTIEFDSREVVKGLGEFGVAFGQLREMISLPDNIFLGEE